MCRHQHGWQVRRNLSVVVFFFAVAAVFEDDFVVGLWLNVVEVFFSAADVDLVSYSQSWS